MLLLSFFLACGDKESDTAQSEEVEQLDTAEEEDTSSQEEPEEGESDE